MSMSFFSSVKSQHGELLTAERFNQMTEDPIVKQLCDSIAREPDHEKQQQMKKMLPGITPNAWFDGPRKNELAHPSGFFMLDIDGVENPFEMWSRIIARREELGILLAHKTPSTHGLRLVCRCRKEFSTIDECQQWLAKEIGVKHDPACKDWARFSYGVPFDYIYYIDGKGLFEEEPEVVYDIVKSEEIAPLRSQAVSPAEPGRRVKSEGASATTPDAQPLTFKGILLSDIALEWLKETGGEPVEGERNDRLHKLAYALRNITDFNEQVLLKVLPRYGLSEDEMHSIIHSACAAPRSVGMPKTLKQVLEKMTSTATGDDSDDERSLTDATQDGHLPPLPPLFRQLAKIAPSDFVIATILCLLPLGGALGSKLRARYLDRSLHSPSFQVSLEAPQASGKSFMSRLAKLLLAPIIDHDTVERQREQEYNERVAELKVTGIKVTPENRDELLGQRPKGIIRYVPATISITKMLMRMENAQGLHLVAVCEEIDTVTKAFKRAISSYSDALRVSFDNGPYGQDYASENSYSGILPLYYNTLFSGTPKAMRRFYPDVEDGLVSRVLFVTLPDQFGKPMPVWGELNAKDKEEVEAQIKRLNEVSIVGEVVQPIHEMQLDFLNRAMDLWLKEQQREAVRTNNRTLDIFCRRAAVVGFRAGMLAWFLYGEKETRTVRKNTVAFAQWVAAQMLTQHLLRFEIDGTGSNTNHWEEAYRLLPDEFTREDLQRTCNVLGKNTPIKNVVYNWRLLGCIEITETVTASNGKQQAVRFRKK